MVRIHADRKESFYILRLNFWNMLPWADQNNEIYINDK